MTQDETVQILKEAGAIVSGHFVYTSGRHGPQYINKQALYQCTTSTSRISEAIAQQFRLVEVNTIVHPSGARKLASWVMHHLYRMNNSPLQLVESLKIGDETFRIGYHGKPLGKILVVEDIINTGGTARKIVDASENLGATVIGVGAIWNRGGTQAAQLISNIPIEALVNRKLISHNSESCHLCRKGVPINETIGHGHEFLVPRVTEPRAPEAP